FYPQFIPADAPVLAWTAALAAVQVTLETGLYLGVECRRRSRLGVVSPAEDPPAVGRCDGRCSDRAWRTRRRNLALRLSAQRSALSASSLSSLLAADVVTSS